MHAHAGRGLCCAADRRFALCRAIGCRARADARAAKRDPLQLPLRFHGELFWRAEGRERSDAMSERQCRKALLRLSAGREGGYVRARGQASCTARHSGTCGSCTLRFASSPSADSACRRDTPGTSSCRFPRRNKTSDTRCIATARGAGTAGSEERREASSEPTTDDCRPACRDRRCAAPGVCPGAHQVPGGIPRSLLRRGYRWWPRGRLPASKRRVAFTNLPKWPCRIRPLTRP
jgi:hypothetical protein